MNLINFDEIAGRIIEISGCKAIIDSDVADLYGVETKRINEAVRNNPDKFPEGYVVQISKDQWDLLKTKFSTSVKGGKVKPPNAFTEKGLYMLATILKGRTAVQTTILIIETFSKIREIQKNIKELADVKEEEHKDNLLKKSSTLITEILDDDLKIKDTETSVELNLAVLRFKHVIKRGS